MHRDDRRVAMLATVPVRKHVLAETIASLRPQVDTICVYLNGHTEVPECLRDLDGQLCLATSADWGDRGDGGKFYWAASFGSVWYLTCDDDFRYAPGYVDHLVDAALELDGAVSLHGVVLSEPLAAGEPVDWLTAGRTRWLRACDAVREPTPVHILGTGVGCYHANRVRVFRQDFAWPHSADVTFSALCQRQGVRRFVTAHPPGLAVQIAPPLEDGPKALRWSGEYAKRVAAHAPWKLHTEMG